MTYVLLHSKAVEQVVCSNIADCNCCLANATVEDFLWLTSSQLQEFIHTCLFGGNALQKVQIFRTDEKLNKTRHRYQTAEYIEQDCSKSELCLVWYVWILRGDDLVLQQQQLYTVAITDELKINTDRLTVCMEA